jgi:hypothetical protein
MSRDLTEAVQSAIEATQVQPFLLFEGVFANGTLRVWSGYGDLNWNGYTWTGTGSLGAVSSVQETSQVQANGISVSLSGIPSDLISLILQDCRQGKSGRLYLGFWEDGGIVSSPYMIFQGKLDVPSIQESGDTAIITITYESRLIDLQRPRETRLTNEEQQREYAGDLGCEFVPAMKEITLTWGRS